MTGIPQALLARLGALALVFTLGLGAGACLQASRTAATALQQAKADSAAAARTAVQATAAVAAVGADTAAIRSNTATVTERISHAPLVARPASVDRISGGPAVAAPVHAVGGRGFVAPDGSLGLAGGAGTATDAAGRVAAPVDAVDSSADVRLSLAAVSLWNSALAGQVVSAGACRADDPASEACALASEAGLEDAWLNHATNAGSCAEDRARYQRLIDFLQLQRAR